MILRTGAAALGLGLAGCTSFDRSDSASAKPRKVLFFTKSSGYEHSVIKSVNGQPSFAQQILTELGPKHGIEFTFSKDGSLFTPEYLAQFDAYFFYTTGNLTEAGKDKNPPMTPEGKAAFLDAIKRGKGFIGTHSATDTFHTGEREDMPADQVPTRDKNYGDAADPYVRMIGAEFIHHDKQQVAAMRVADPKFPGFKDRAPEFKLMEEWYSLKDFSSNLHVILVQETAGMEGQHYQRPPYPATWARMHGKGRVFYTSMGHREDVWTNPIYQEMLFGGIAWAVRNVNADITPNLLQAAPDCMTLPPATPPPVAKAKAKA
jgi:type 1 glutamine amidotransferase